MSRSDAASAFRAARRHSRLVRTLRIALPLAVVFTFAAITIMTYFNPLRSLGGLPKNIGSTVLHGTKITMEQPKLSGFTHDQRAYNLTADSAAQDLTTPDIIDLNNIRAKIEMKDKSTVRMSALRGIYNSKSEMLDLKGDIRLESTNGYTGRLSEATVDIKKGGVLSKHPVRLEMLNGTLDANRLHITNSGDQIVFDRGVKMTVLFGGNDVAKATQSSRAESGAASGAQ